MSKEQTVFSSCLVGERALLIQCGEVLLQKGHVVRGVISDAAEVVRWAEGRGLRVLQLDSPKVVSALAEQAFDYLFSIANLRLLPKEIVRLPRRCAINFHDGPLPRYAGIHATSWALMNGERQHGVTWHEIAEAIDGGRILKQRAVEIAPDETAYSLNVKCFEAGAASFAELVEEFATGTAKAGEQDLSKRTYFGMWKRPAGGAVISWANKAANIEALVRGLEFGPHENALGRAKIRVGDEYLVCAEAEVATAAGRGSRGRIAALDSDGMVVETENGAVRIGRLLTLDGQGINGDELGAKFGLKVGAVLPEMDAGCSERITELHGKCARHEKFWVARLSEWKPAALERENRNGAEVGSVRMEVPAGFVQTRGIYEPSRCVLAAFAVYVGRVSGEDEFDLAWSWPELAQEVSGLKGLFAGEVPVRLRLDGSAAFVTAAAGVEGALRATQEHGSYLLDIWARYPELHGAVRQEALRSLVVSIERPEDLETQRDDGAAVRLRIASDGKRCRLDFGAGRLSAKDAGAIAAQFRTLLEGIARHPELPISRLPLLSEAEQKTVLVEWNRTERPFAYDQCIHEAFEAQVQRTPEAVAVVCGEEQVSYAELNERANRLAARLQEIGLGPDRLAGVFLDRSIEMVVCLLGVLKAGGAYVPLDPAYPKDRLQFMLEDAQAAIVLTQSHLRSQLPAAQARVVCVDDDGKRIKAESTATPKAGVESRHLAYVIYTSGSTGKPKGVMVEHRNVINFFAGMDERIEHAPGDTWLAVTSLSFDISVLELFWSLSRGFKVIIYTGEDMRSAPARTARAVRPLDFSLFYFSADQSQDAQNKYRLLLEGARFADENGFSAVWTPERHFHDFGGLYPNPAVTSAAVAAITRRVQVRSGSVVAPLHSPIRIAEEWSVVDNLSNGRAAISFASGWMPEDFVLRPENFAARKQLMAEYIDVVRRLWRGESASFPGPLGKEVPVRIMPRPVQAELPVWITAAGNPETFELAGRLGANVLTHVLGQNIDELGQKIQVYRKAWQHAGHAGKGHVTLMLHTFVSDNPDFVKDTVRGPLTNYLRTSADLIKHYSWAFPAFKNQGKTPAQINFGDLPKEDIDAVLGHAFDRYYETGGLFGTPETCLETVEKLRARDVDEIACLIDFGAPTEAVLQNLKHLARLRINTIQAPVTEEATISALLRKHHVTHLQCTPSMASMLLLDGEAREAIGSLKCWMIGGEGLPEALASEVTKLVRGPVINMYGPTETTVWSSTWPVSDSTMTVSIGRPIANTSMYVLDRNFQPVPVGVAGELMIGGAGVVRGYLNRPELTGERFIRNPFTDDGTQRMYRTGDLARFLPDGNIELLGRLDHQVKVRGHRIELGEIEAALSRHPSVRESVVIAREDVPGDKRLVAYVIAREPGFDTDALEEHVKACLPEFMVPAQIVRMDSFPQTPNRKIDRKALPRPDEGTAPRCEVEEPADDVERAIASLWQEILGATRIGRNESFFAAGGHSLSAVQVVAKIRERFQVNLPLRTFFQHPTVSGLADAVNEFMARRSTEAEAASNKGAKNGTDIRPMRANDLEPIIDLHMAHFPDWRNSRLGRPFVRKMYRWFLTRHSGLAWVAVKQDRVLGFTVGKIGDHHWSMFLYTLPQAFAGHLRRPSLLFERKTLEYLAGLGRVRTINGQSTHVAPGKNRIAENMIMVADKAVDHAGIDLMVAFEEAARQRGATAVFHPPGHQDSRTSITVHD